MLRIGMHCQVQYIWSCCMWRYQLESSKSYCEIPTKNVPSTRTHSYSSSINFHDHPRTVFTYKYWGQDFLNGKVCNKCGPTSFRKEKQQNNENAILQVRKTLWSKRHHFEENEGWTDLLQMGYSEEESGAYWNIISKLEVD